ncbi:MAG: hypothetical protein ABIK09_08110 [Pseudomonadota bacterium]
MKWMTKLVVLVALLGLAAGCGGDKKEGEKKDEAKTEKKAEPENKDAPEKAEPGKVEPAKAEPATDEPATDEPAKAEPATDEPVVDAPAKDEPATDVPATAPEGDGSGLTAEKTVTTFAGYLIIGNVQGVWGLVPPSYRADLSSVVKVVTTGMDKEVFEAVVAVLDRVLNAVEKNKDKLVQQIAAFAGPEAPAKDITMAVDGILDAWKGIKAAGFDKYDTFATFDLDKFVSEQGTVVAKGLLEMAKASGNAEVMDFFKLAASLKVETIEETADKAKLKITFGDETEEGELVKVDGYWIPEDMAKDWDEIKGAAAEAKEAMAELTKNKAEIIATLKQIEPVLAQFEASGDLMAVMGAMGGGGMGAPPAMDDEEKATPPEIGEDEVPEVAPEGTAPEVAPAPEAAPAE